MYKYNYKNTLARGRPSTNLAISSTGNRKDLIPPLPIF